MNFFDSVGGCAGTTSVGYATDLNFSKILKTAKIKLNLRFISKLRFF